LKIDRLAISSRVLSYVRARLQERSPRSLLDEREHRLYCIVALEHAGDAADLDCWLISLMQQIEVDFDMQLFAGISSVCSDIRDYRRGSAEAQEALQIGLRLLRNSSNASSARFSELSAYRYLYPFAREHQLSDAYLDHIETLARYDREHKRGNLLHSLETYLALGGNIKEAAERLKVHRNTLTQRLERIQSLCAINLDASNERFSLQLALMIYRLR
jgi:DNA-binding PucR family transcriptional regulator